MTDEVPGSASAGLSTFDGQASLNGGGGNDESAAFPFMFTPSASLQDAAWYTPWSHNTDDNPSSAQSDIKNRRPFDGCDAETDLRGLVSNILDEADSQDSYYSDGSLPVCNSIWSPKTLREDLLQYLPSEAKIQHNPAFPLNYVSHEPFSKAQGESVAKDIGQFYPHSSGFTANQQCSFNLPNGDRDNSILQTKKLPPGLPLPNIGNTYLSPIQNNKCDKMSADSRNGQLLNDFPELGEAFRPHREMNRPYFEPYYNDYYTQSSRKSIGMEQAVSKDMNQLVSIFESFMTDKHDSFANSPNINKHMLDMHHRDSTVPLMSTQTPTAVPTRRLVGEFGIAQREQNGAWRKQLFTQADFQDLPRLSPHDMEYLQQLRETPTSFNHLNQYQNGENICQYQKHGIEQSKIQMMPQVQKMHMSGFVDHGISARLPTNRHTKEGQKKMSPAKNTYGELQGSRQSPKFDSRKSVRSRQQQLMSPMYPVNEPRRCSSLLNNSSFSSRSNGMPNGSGVFPGMDVGDMVSASASAALNFYASDMMTCRRESTTNDMASSVTPPAVARQEVPELDCFLDVCYEQWMCLEKERNGIEVILSKTFHGKWTAAVTNTTYSNTPPNPTRVDNLIIKQMREEAKVASLFEKMESVSNTPLHMNIHTALNRHHEAICITQARRNEEIANAMKHQQQQDTLLAFAISDLAATTSQLRSALWWALQMILPKPVKRQYHNYKVMCSERFSSPFEGYSFSRRHSSDIYPAKQP